MQGIPYLWGWNNFDSMIFVISWAKKKVTMANAVILGSDKRSDLGDLICQLVVELKS